MKVLPVARLTFKEIMEDKFLKMVILVEILIAVLSYYLSNISAGDNVKIAMDFIISFFFFITAIFSVLVASNSMRKDLSEKVIYLILSKPFSRNEYVFGKSVGFLGVSGVFASITGVVMLFSFYIINWISRLYRPHEIMFFRVLCFAFLLFLLGFFLMTVTLFFSMLFASFNLVPLMGFLTFVAGLELSPVKELVMSSRLVGEWNKLIVKLVYYFFPNFSLYNIRDALVYKSVSLKFSYIAGVAIYTFFYALIIVIVSSLFLERKEL
ncbi:hypothetical protein [Desulfurobacterium sp.]